MTQEIAGKMALGSQEMASNLGANPREESQNTLTTEGAETAGESAVENFSSGVASKLVQDAIEDVKGSNESLTQQVKEDDERVETVPLQTDYLGNIESGKIMPLESDSLGNNIVDSKASMESELSSSNKNLDENHNIAVERAETPGAEQDNAPLDKCVDKGEDLANDDSKEAGTVNAAEEGTDIPETAEKEDVGEGVSTLSPETSDSDVVIPAKVLTKDENEVEGEAEGVLSPSSETSDDVVIPQKQEIHQMLEESTETELGVQKSASDTSASSDDVIIPEKKVPVEMQEAVDTSESTDDVVIPEKKLEVHEEDLTAEKSSSDSDVVIPEKKVPVEIQEAMDSAGDTDDVVIPENELEVCEEDLTAGVEKSSSGDDDVVIPMRQESVDESKEEETTSAEKESVEDTTAGVAEDEGDTEVTAVGGQEIVEPQEDGSKEAVSKDITEKEVHDLLDDFEFIEMPEEDEEISGEVQQVESEKDDSSVPKENGLEPAGVTEDHEGDSEQVVEQVMQQVAETPLEDGALADEGPVPEESVEKAQVEGATIRELEVVPEEPAMQVNAAEDSGFHETKEDLKDVVQESQQALTAGEDQSTKPAPEDVGTKEEDDKPTVENQLYNIQFSYDELVQKLEELEKKLQEEPEKETDIVRVDTDSSDLQKTLTELEEKNRSLEKQLQQAELEIKESKEKMGSGDISDLQNKISTLEKRNSEMELELRSLKNEKQSLEAKVSESEEKLKTFQDLKAQDVTVERLNDEKKSLIDKIHTLEKELATLVVSPENDNLKKEKLVLQKKIRALEKELSALRKDKMVVDGPKDPKQRQDELGKQLEDKLRSQQRISELEDKVENLTDENLSLAANYEEAVKALQAVEKTFSQTNAATDKYRKDLAEAQSSIKSLKDSLGSDGKRVESMKNETKKLRHQLKKAEERVKLLEKDELVTRLEDLQNSEKKDKEHIDKLKSSLQDLEKEVEATQTRARDRGKRIQMMQMEITEVRDALSMAKGVIDEKEKSLTETRTQLKAESQKVKSLEETTGKLATVKSKKKTLKKEKKNLEKQLSEKEKQLEEQTEIQKKIEAEKEKKEKELEEDFKTMQLRFETADSEVKRLSILVDDKDTQIEESLNELAEVRQNLAELEAKFDEVMVLQQHLQKKRPRSAPHKKSKSDGYAQNGVIYGSPGHRRIVHKIGRPQINPAFINNYTGRVMRKKNSDLTQPKRPTTEPPADSNKRIGRPKTAKPMRSSTPDNDRDVVVEEYTSLDGSESSPIKTSPYHPERPRSTYGVRTHPPYLPSPPEDRNLRRQESHGTLGTEDSSASAERYEEEHLKSLVHVGDRVMIQCDIAAHSYTEQSDEDLSGVGKRNVTGIVKYVGKIRRQDLEEGVQVGLKLDEPVGDSNGVVEGRKLFSCLPRHGKVVNLKEIHSVFNPRTLHYKRIKPNTSDFLA